MCTFTQKLVEIHSTIERKYKNKVEIGERDSFLGREGFIDERRYIEPMRKRGGRKKNWVEGVTWIFSELMTSQLVVRNLVLCYISKNPLSKN